MSTPGRLQSQPIKPFISEGSADWMLMSSDSSKIDAQSSLDFIDTDDNEMKITSSEDSCSSENERRDPFEFKRGRTSSENVFTRVGMQYKVDDERPLNQSSLKSEASDGHDVVTSQLRQTQSLQLPFNSANVDNNFQNTRPNSEFNVARQNIYLPGTQSSFSLRQNRLDKIPEGLELKTLYRSDDGLMSKQTENISFSETKLNPDTSQIMYKDSKDNLPTNKESIKSRPEKMVENSLSEGQYKVIKSRIRPNQSPDVGIKLSDSLEQKADHVNNTVESAEINQLQSVLPSAGRIVTYDTSSEISECSVVSSSPTVTKISRATSSVSLENACSPSVSCQTSD